MQGSQVTQRYLERYGFRYPISVARMEGLGLRLPPPDFSVRDVERYVGKERLSEGDGSLGCIALFSTYITMSSSARASFNINFIKRRLHVMGLNYSAATTKIRC